MKTVDQFVEGLCGLGDFVTASGLYPIRAVETMVNIAAIAEQHIIRGAAQDRSIVKTDLEGREALVEIRPAEYQSPAGMI